NEQPWRFCVGTVDATPETHQLLQSFLMEGNAWAKKAPVLILSVAKRNFTYNGKPNRHALHDVGLAVENMVLQAQSMGLHAHQMAGFHADLAAEKLGLPPEYEPVAMIAIGYMDEPDTLSEELK